MRATKVQATSSGPAARLLPGRPARRGCEVASFRQRFRVRLGRPMLELRVEIESRQPIEGYPWHSYFAVRFARARRVGALAQHHRPAVDDEPGTARRRPTTWRCGPAGRIP
ncbi:MAG: hypothetical protein U0797_14165 [Gemmataceae bacterium]